MNKREKRKKNIIITGLEYSEDSTEDIVMTFIENKLELEGIEICSYRRIG